MPDYNERTVIMFDFFDEDFPLTKKQEEEYRKKLKEEAAESSAAEADLPAEEAALKTEDVSEKTVVSEAVFENASSESGVDGFEDVVIDRITVAEEAETDDTDSDFYGEDAGDVEDDVMSSDYDESPAVDYAAEIERIMNGGEDEEQPMQEDLKPYEPAIEPQSEGTYDEWSAEPENQAEEEPAAEDIEAEAESSADVSENEAEENSEAEKEAEPAEQSVKEEPEEKPAEPDYSEKIASLDEIEAHLHEELKSLGEKLDSMERVVDGMDDGEISEGFDYEYDDRYYAEEETPAYLHPEIYKTEKKQVPVKAAPKKPRPSGAEIDTGRIVRAGAAVAAAALAIALLGGKKDK